MYVRQKISGGKPDKGFDVADFPTLGDVVTKVIDARPRRRPEGARGNAAPRRDEGHGRRRPSTARRRLERRGSARQLERRRDRLRRASRSSEQHRGHAPRRHAAPDRVDRLGLGSGDIARAARAASTGGGG